MRAITMAMAQVLAVVVLSAGTMLAVVRLVPDVLPQGPPGPAGPAGPQGERGLRGLTGSTVGPRAGDAQRQLDEQQSQIDSAKRRECRRLYEAWQNGDREAIVEYGQMLCDQG